MGRSASLGPLDPELGRPSAGVGIVSRRPKPFCRPRALTKDMAAARTTGRADKFILSLFSGITLTAYNIYGWTMGEASEPARIRTNDLVAACIDEQLQVKGPAIIAGDLNCLATSLPVLRCAFGSATWFDAALLPAFRSEHTVLGTCLAPIAVERTRRDFILVNRDALSLISGFRICTAAQYAVHRPVQITFGKPEIPRSIRVPVVPKSFFDAYTATHDKQLTKSLIHWHMDSLFRSRAKSLFDLLVVGHTSDYWHLWSSTVEEAFLRALDIRDPAPYQGHGTLSTSIQPHRQPHVGGGWPGQQAGYPLV